MGTFLVSGIAQSIITFASFVYIKKKFSLYNLSNETRKAEKRLNKYLLAHVWLFPKGGDQVRQKVSWAEPSPSF